jgi:hypothetical protein
MSMMRDTHLDPNDPATWAASVAYERARKAEAMQTPSDLANIQAAYDAQSPSVRTGGTVVEYEHVCPDDTPEQHYHFTLTMRGGELNGVVLDRLVLHFPEWLVEPALSVEQKGQIEDWFESVYANKDWVRDEVWQQIKDDEE